MSFFFFLIQIRNKKKFFGKEQLVSYEPGQLELIYLITGHVDMLYYSIY